MGKAFQRLPRQHGSSDGNGRGAVKEPRALQHRLRQQVREAETEAAVSQDLSLSMLAGEVAAGERCALRHRQRGQMKGAAVEAEEPHNSV